MTYRAAFDLGSGKFKLLVGFCPTEETCDTPLPIITIFERLVDVPLGEDFAESKNGELSERIQEIALNTLTKLKKDAVSYGATEFSGIATATFRKAKNGLNLLKRMVEKTGVRLQIISQEKEGIIGYNTGLALYEKYNLFTTSSFNGYTCERRESQRNSLIVWDSGNSSFQITSLVEKSGKNILQVYQGPLGNSIVTKLFLEKVRKVPYTISTKINPVTSEEITTLVSILKSEIERPEWMNNKVNVNDGIRILAIGDLFSIFAITSRVLGKNSLRSYSNDNEPLTLSLVKEGVEKITGKTSQEISWLDPSDPETLVSRIVLLFAVMEKFGVNKVDFYPSTGGTLGIISDPDFWYSP